MSAQGGDGLRAGQFQEPLNRDTLRSIHALAIHNLESRDLCPTSVYRSFHRRMTLVQDMFS